MIASGKEERTNLSQKLTSNFKIQTITFVHDPSKIIYL